MDASWRYCTMADITRFWENLVKVYIFREGHKNIKKSPNLDLPDTNNRSGQNVSVIFGLKYNSRLGGNSSGPKW